MADLDVIDHRARRRFLRDANLPEDAHAPLPDLRTFLRQQRLVRNPFVMAEILAMLGTTPRT